MGSPGRLDLAVHRMEPSKPGSEVATGSLAATGQLLPIADLNCSNCQSRPTFKAELASTSAG